MKIVLIYTEWFLLGKYFYSTEIESKNQKLKKEHGCSSYVFSGTIQGSDHSSNIFNNGTNILAPLEV